MRKQTRRLSELYSAVDEAEEEYGLSVEWHLDKPDVISIDLPQQNLSGEIIERIKEMSATEVEQAVLVGVKRFSELPAAVIGVFTQKLQGNTGVIYELVKALKTEEKKMLLDKLYLSAAKAVGIDSNPADFVSMSLSAMVRLQTTGKSNLVFKLCQGFAFDWPDKSGPLIPMNRMPFGMLQ